MKKITALLLAFILMALTACSGNTLASTTPVSPAQATSAGSATSAPAATATVVVTPIVVEYDTEDLVVNDSDATTIQLNGDAIAFTGSGVAVDGSRATITAGGTYRISGVLDNGQIIVNTGDKEKVTLILDGATLTCADNAPIYVVQADKVVITLADGSTNVVSDGATYNAEAVAADEPDAAIFSKADLTLNGGGALVVNATYNHGIVSKDDLKITGGTITVNAVVDGVKGRDSVAIKDGALTIHAGGDGVQANNDEDAEKGVIAIEGGVLVITAGQ
ncbi:MAG TPA: carbohydrate-binding domain-containing protein, partial [Anaerolineae bacterium]|nr:carbohydrate-binding domain-containing protein [Anaerolineae bacterium]